MKARITNLFLMGAGNRAYLVTGPGMSPRTVNLRRIFIAEIGWRNPFRVCPLVGSIPRVARSSQPWALMHNPFGIETRGNSKVCRLEVGDTADWETCATYGGGRNRVLPECAERKKQTWD